jgi:hypothetical protein
VLVAVTLASTTFMNEKGECVWIETSPYGVISGW